MNGWLYAGLCVTLPAAWGALMAWLFGIVDKKRREIAKGDPPPIDYSI